MNIGKIFLHVYRMDVHVLILLWSVCRRLLLSLKMLVCLRRICLSRRDPLQCWRCLIVPHDFCRGWSVVMRFTDVCLSLESRGGLWRCSSWSVSGVPGRLVSENASVVHVSSVVLVGWASEGAGGGAGLELSLQGWVLQLTCSNTGQDSVIGKDMFCR